MNIPIHLGKQRCAFLLSTYLGMELLIPKEGVSIAAICACRLSCTQLFETLWNAAHQAPLSMGFSRQEYWSRLQFLSPGDLPNPRIKPMSLALAGRFFIYRACREEGKGKGLGDYNTFT